MGARIMLPLSLVLLLIFLHEIPLFGGSWIGKFDVARGLCIFLLIVIMPARYLTDMEQFNRQKFMIDK